MKIHDPQLQNQNSTGERRVLAVSSGGGHWIQLMMLKPAFERHQCSFASERTAYAKEVPGSRFYTLKKANRWNPFLLLILSLELLGIVVRERPDVVISTGAACGVFAIVLAKIILRSKTIWIDSIANCSHLSLSGRLVKPFADIWLTQWQHLAHTEGADYWGRVF